MYGLTFVATRNRDAEGVHHLAGGPLAALDPAVQVPLAEGRSVLASEVDRSFAKPQEAPEVGVLAGPPLGTKTIIMYVSDLDQSEIPAGEAYQLSIRHPDGSTQQLDISEKNYRDLKLAGVGKTLKKRGRRPGSTTGTADAPRRRRPRQTSEPPVTA